jgi:hypothetical protein
MLTTAMERPSSRFSGAVVAVNSRLTRASQSATTRVVTARCGNA